MIGALRRVVRGIRRLGRRVAGGRGETYGRELTAAEIAVGAHRDVVGGMWDEIGRLQFDFLVRRGLVPRHTLLDVGCGALRGGLHFIRYLEAGHYCGLDINRSLIEAGRAELRAADLAHKTPRLLVNDQFEFHRFGAQFDVALAQSVFTHLVANRIARCLVEVKKVLKPDGAFYATFFRAPHAAHIEPIHHAVGGKTTRCDANPFHYSYDELRRLGEDAGLTAMLIGDWHHPRSQQMIAFQHAG